MQCIRCGNTLPEGVRFCQACGLPVTPMTPNVPDAAGYTDFAFQEFNLPPINTPPMGVPGAPYVAGPGALVYPPFGVPGAPVQPKRRGRSVGCIVLYVLLAVLVVFVGLGVALFEIGSHALANVNAQKTAAMHLYQQVTSAQPSLAEPLTNPSATNWDTYQGSTYGCAMQKDGLHVHISDANRFFYCTDGDSAVSNIAFQVRVQILSGEGGGLVFRVGDNNGQGLYGFELDTDGSYQVFLDKDSTTTPTNLATGTTNAADKGISALNTLTLIEQGDQFYFYINGGFVVQVKDATLQTGSAGVLASDGGSPAEVAYTNAKIWDMNS